MLFVLLIFLLLVSSVLGAKVADSDGTITINNVHGGVNASFGNILTIIFREPGSPSNGGGGGGGSGGFDKPDVQEEEEEVIGELDELLGTVEPSELGFVALSTDKMLAEKTDNFVTKSKLDSSGLVSWIGSVKKSSAQDAINSMVNDLEEGNLEALSVEHQAEVFRITTIYSNTDAYTYRTRVIIKITASKDVSDVRVLELIPKGFASSASSLVFTSDVPEILEDDPLLQWSIPSMSNGETRSLTYYIKEKIAGDSFKTVAVYGALKPAVVDQPTLTGDVVEEPEEEPESGKGFSFPRIPLIWPIIIIVVVGGLIAGIIIRKKMVLKQKAMAVSKPEPENLLIRPGLIVPYDKIRQVEKFIENEARSGKSDTEIKQDLLATGWDEHTLDIIMHDVHVVDHHVDKLDHFVKMCIDKDMTLSQIRTTLINVGWREDIVDLLLDDFR